MRLPAATDSFDQICFDAIGHICATMKFLDQSDSSESSNWNQRSTPNRSFKRTCLRHAA
jgi:hypothetical protein